MHSNIEFPIFLQQQGGREDDLDHATYKHDEYHKHDNIISKFWKNTEAFPMTEDKQICGHHTTQSKLYINIHKHYMGI